MSVREQIYYSRNAEQFGKAGDFYTSSDVHAVFGRLLARQFDEMWQALDRPPEIEILELGPGRGLFARDVLDWSNKKFPDFFSALTYTLQESSPALRNKLQDTLENHLASGKAVISGETSEERPTIHRSLAPGTPLIVFANEFFDALPMEIWNSSTATAFIPKPASASKCPSWRRIGSSKSRAPLHAASC